MVIKFKPKIANPNTYQNLNSLSTVGNIINIRLYGGPMQGGEVFDFDPDKKSVITIGRNE